MGIADTEYGMFAGSYEDFTRWYLECQLRDKSVKHISYLRKLQEDMPKFVEWMLNFDSPTLESKVNLEKSKKLEEYCVAQLKIYRGERDITLAFEFSKLTSRLQKLGNDISDAKNKFDLKPKFT